MLTTIVNDNTYIRCALVTICVSVLMVRYTCKIVLSISHFTLNVLVFISCFFYFLSLTQFQYRHLVMKRYFFAFDSLYFIFTIQLCGKQTWNSICLVFFTDILIVIHLFFFYFCFFLLSSQLHCTLLFLSIRTQQSHLGVVRRLNMKFKVRGERKRCVFDTKRMCRHSQITEIPYLIDIMTH